MTERKETAGWAVGTGSVNDESAVTIAINGQMIYVPTDDAKLMASLLLLAADKVEGETK